MTRHFFEVLAERAALDPDRPAFTMIGADAAPGSSITFAELEARARRMSRVLRGVAPPGDRAVLLAPSSLDYIVGFFGCLHAGVIAVPAYAPHPRRADERVDGIMRDASPSLVVTTRALADTLRGSRAASNWNAELAWIETDASQCADPATEDAIAGDGRGLAFLQYTSGSTREPRGVRVTHANLLHNTAGIAARLGVNRGEPVVTWLPLFHDMGLVGGVLSAIRTGAHVHLMTPTDFTARPALWLETLSRARAVMTMGPNFAYELCAKRIPDDVANTLDLSALRVALSGAEPVRAETIDAFSARFAAAGFRREAFFPAYGMAECTLMVSGEAADRLAQVPVEGRAHVACGTPLDGLEVTTVDGELWVSGPSVADGYWNRERESEETFGARVPGCDRRYLRTGDLGAVVDGQIVITGRAKDLLILRGTNVHPQDVEAAIGGCHPALTGGIAAVGGMMGGEERLVVVAEVDRRSVTQGVDGTAVLAAVRAAIGGAVNAEVGALVLVRPLSIPRTSSGKIRRAACRAAWSSGELAAIWSWSIDTPHESAAPESPGDDVVAVIREAIARELRIAAPRDLDVDRPLAELGLDSLGLVAVRGAVEARLGSTISIAAIGDNPTIRELADRLRDGVHVERAPASASSPQQWAEVDLSIMFFSADAGDAQATKSSYEFVLEACRTADRAGLRSVWIPERHFHRFGGLFPNPSVIAAAVAAVTRNVRIRAGSVVLPLHDPVRVREEWAVVDQLSGGRVDLAFASGWDANSYSLKPELYATRKAATLDGIDAFESLWRGDPVRRRNGHDREVELTPLPMPRQAMPGLWLTVAQDSAMFVEAGRRGLNVLTALLFQSVAALAANIRLYREARRAAGLIPDAGRVTLMLHTFVGEDERRVKEMVRGPLERYLETSVELWSQESRDLSTLSPADRAAVVELAFERYYRESGLFGSLERARETLSGMRAAGVDEVACLVDFGVPGHEVLRGVEMLGRLTRAAAIEAERTDIPRVRREAVDMSRRTAPARPKTRDVFAGPMSYEFFDQVRDAGLMTFYQEFGERRGPYIRHGDRWLLQLGSLDYLGLAVEPRVREAAALAARNAGTSRTGSRLHNGSTPEQRAFEERLAEFLGREDALVFATGYQAQVGLISGLADPDTTVVLDEHAHASLYDGALISRCRIARFRHNDPDDLERTLAALPTDAPALVVSEGLYSNEGDLAPLREIVSVCAGAGVRLALDEAHGLGVLGATGRGTEEELEIPGAVDILAGTFSKSLASVGGWIAGPARVIDWIRFHGRSILFSAAISPASLGAAAESLEIIATEPRRVAKLRDLARRWRDALRARGLEIGDPHGPIVPIYLGDDLRCLRVSRDLMERGVYVNTVVPPSVPPGKALLRTCVTAAHEWEQLERAADILADVVHASMDARRDARPA